MTTPHQPANAELIEMLEMLAKLWDGNPFLNSAAACCRDSAAALRAAAEREARLREALEVVRTKAIYYDTDYIGIKVNRAPGWRGLVALINAALAARTPGGTQRDDARVLPEEGRDVTPAGKAASCGSVCLRDDQGAEGTA